jgi:hypothetical protein
MASEINPENPAPWSYEVVSGFFLLFRSLLLPYRAVAYRS